MALSLSFGLDKMLATEAWEDPEELSEPEDTSQLPDELLRLLEARHRQGEIDPQKHAEVAGKIQRVEAKRASDAGAATRQVTSPGR